MQIKIMGRTPSGLFSHHPLEIPVEDAAVIAHPDPGPGMIEKHAPGRFPKNQAVELLVVDRRPAVAAHQPDQGAAGGQKFPYRGEAESGTKKPTEPASKTAVKQPDGGKSGGQAQEGSPRLIKDKSRADEKHEGRQDSSPKRRKI